MTLGEGLADRPLDNFGYFLEWGGRNWEKLFRYALEEFIGINQVSGAKALEVGARRGRVSVLFSLLGANVTAIDLDADALRVARREAEAFGVADKVDVHYDGNLDALADAEFDLVFTKSVLVAVKDLDKFVSKLVSKLRPGGLAVFLENRRSNRLMQGLRRLKHRRWDCRRVNCLTSLEIDYFGRHLEIEEIRTTAFPPTYLVMGRRRS